ncbi:hypothetical protein HELRODRAFT_178235 [Helobdella robusta]|uniref:Uncharacterized protein n=1 Tax=Helobdella robusta TaxID=6412 RepID=T1FCZ3_HELRO|nr:hypothetical protein HELRODRAFT_178235 [Helobdella robusta]ESN97438.1 hypothetical protein HELRODRAFT_178235 [Helobdella robusta]
MDAYVKHFPQNNRFLVSRVVSGSIPMEVLLKYPRRDARVLPQQHIQNGPYTVTNAFENASITTFTGTYSPGMKLEIQMCTTFPGSQWFSKLPAKERARKNFLKQFCGIFGFTLYFCISRFSRMHNNNGNSFISIKVNLMNGRK